MAIPFKPCSDCGFPVYETLLCGRCTQKRELIAERDEALAKLEHEEGRVYKLEQDLYAAEQQRDEALAKLEQTQRAMDAYATRCDELSVRLRQSEALLLANEEADEPPDPDWDRYWGSKEE